MKRKRLENVVKVMLEMTPDRISTDNISMILVNFMIHKNMVNQWPVVKDIVDDVFVEYLVRSSYQSDAEYNEAIAIEDANNFLENIRNDV
tara:strand:- start:437 stop:706 length:270 start_codon:yes stop_codon:yes gene_type:complete